jgi:N-acyl-D-amino-acid deacylase
MTPRSQTPTRLRRRRLVTGLLGGLPAAALLAACRRDGRADRAAQGSGVAVTGPASPGMESLDRFVTALMERWEIPGGAVAVTRNGQLVFAHGYGVADRVSGEATRPDSLFRVASLSKSLTALAILTLVGEGRLDLDAKAFSLLNTLTPPAGATPDPRLGDITVRQLLHHTGGWDREQTFDPMFASTLAANGVGVPPPAGCETVIRYMRGQPLQFDPGTRYAYSNLGYCILGRIIEQVAGMPYDEYVTRRVLAPAGARGMRLGRTLIEGRAPGEVRYHDLPDAPAEISVFPEQQDQRVPSPYGGFYLEAMAAHGGWIASPVDFLRYMVTLESGRSSGFVYPPKLLAQLFGRPAPPVSENDPSYYGMGWSVLPVSGGANWWHDGSLPGTMTYAVHLANGISWVAFFNTRVRDSDTFFVELDTEMNRTLGGITRWPDQDLFGQFP